MITDLSVTIQKDILQLYDFARGKLPRTLEQDEKVKLASVRVFAALGMVFGALTTISALFKITSVPNLAFAKSLLGIFIYVICHDTFIMCNNKEKGTLEQLKATLENQGKNFVRKLKNVVQGKKEDEIVVPKKVMTDGTYLSLFWSRII